MIQLSSPMQAELFNFITSGNTSKKTSTKGILKSKQYSSPPYQPQLSSIAEFAGTLNAFLRLKIPLLYQFYLTQF